MTVTLGRLSICIAAVVAISQLQVSAAWDVGRIRVMKRYVAEMSDLVHSDPDAHSNVGHIVNAALGQLLAGGEHGVSKAEDLLKYALKNNMAFGLSFGGNFAGPLLNSYADIVSDDVLSNITAALYDELPAEPSGTSTDVSYNNVSVASCSDSCSGIFARHPAPFGW